MWTEWYCTKCKTHNRVCLGNLTDETALDVDAVKCYKCGHTDWINPEAANDILLIYPGQKPEDATVEEGKPPCPHCDGTGVQRETGR